MGNDHVCPVCKGLGPPEGYVRCPACHNSGRFPEVHYGKPRSEAVPGAPSRTEFSDEEKDFIKRAVSDRNGFKKLGYKKIPGRSDFLLYLSIEMRDQLGTCRTPSSLLSWIDKHIGWKWKEGHR